MERKKLVAFLYFIGFLDLFGVSMIIGIMIRAIRNKGVPPSLVGIIGSIYGTIQIFSGPIIGTLSDVYGRKMFLLLSYIGPAVSYLIIGTSSSLILIILGRVLIGSLKQGMSLSKAYLTDITPPNQQTSALGWQNSVSSFGFIIGPLIGGQLAEIDPTLSLPFIAASSIFLLNFFLIAIFIPSDYSSSAAAKKTLNFRQVISSVNVFSRVDWRSQSDLILYRFVSSLAVISFRSNLPIFLEEVFKVDRYGYLGFIMSLSGIIGAMASALAGRVSKFYTNQKTLVIHATLLLALSIMTAAWSPWLPLTIASFVPMSIATSNLRISTTRMMLSRSGDSKGAVIGVGGSVTSLSRAAAPSIVGVAQEMSSEASANFSVFVGFVSLSLTFFISN